MRYITMAIRNHGFTRLRRIVAGLMVAAVFVGLNIVLLFYGVFGVALKDVQMNGVRGFGGIGS